jgi:DNA-3-methyladenine glycosylase II
VNDFDKTIQQAERHLCVIDPALEQIIETGPAFSATPFQKQPFEALVHAIIAQQLSVKSASAIRQRVQALLSSENVSPLAYSQITLPDLKAAGMSQAKINTLQTLCDFALADASPFDELINDSDKDVKDCLCQLKGIGPWTVDIFLMFGLKRLDIFAAGDLGLRKAVKQLNKLEELPSPEETKKVAKKWQPYRTVAAWHLWRTVD